MVLSRAAMTALMQDTCPKLDYPDDMFLGQKAHRHGITIVHSPLFHQVCTLNLAAQKSVLGCGLNRILMWRKSSLNHADVVWRILYIHQFIALHVTGRDVVKTVLNWPT